MSKHEGSSFTQYMLEDYEAQAKENVILKAENERLKVENAKLRNVLSRCEPTIRAIVGPYSELAKQVDEALQTNPQS